MEAIKGKGNGIILCVFELVAGVLLLINPAGFTYAIIMVAGIALMVFGLVQIIKYFRTDAKEASLGQLLVKGLVSILAGAFCTFQTEWFILTFPALTILYGIVILVTGVDKIQLAVDMVRLKQQKWFWPAITAVISILCAVLILKHPFSSTAVLWGFTGATLLAVGILDLITLFVRRAARKAAGTQGQDGSSAGEAKS